jgi:DNA-binding HxlR family transcriptional regulator
MQMNRIVRFHKAMADVTRIRILSVLANGRLSGTEIAEKVGITTATVSHHMKKLREAHLVYERRDKNTIYFELDMKTLKQDSLAIVSMLDEYAKGGRASMESNQTDRRANSSRDRVVDNFFTKDGRLKNIPSQMKKKLIVLEKLMEGIESGRVYEEKEINQHILQFHEDYATIRREWIINRFMHRENGLYTRNPKEMWVTIE